MQLTRFHGVFARTTGYATPCHVAMNWARRLKRVFGIEIEGCARCGGKLKIIASIEEPEVIAKMLAHLEKTAPDQYQAERPLGARAPPSQARLLGIRKRGADSLVCDPTGPGRCMPAFCLAPGKSGLRRWQAGMGRGFRVRRRSGWLPARPTGGFRAGVDRLGPYVRPVRRSRAHCKGGSNFLSAWPIGFRSVGRLTRQDLKDRRVE